jgi:chemotaxis protein MotB
MKKAVLLGLILILGASLLGCVASGQYKKENESLRYEIIKLKNHNEALTQDIAVLQSHNEKLSQQLKDNRSMPTESNTNVDFDPFISKLQRKGIDVTIRDRNPAIVLNDLFDAGDVVISKKEQESVKKIAAILNTEMSPMWSIKVIGYTDNQPIKRVKKYKNNVELSSARAKSVADYLVKECGFDRSRVSSEGLGEENPIASNKTSEGREKNRRVELVIVAR